MRMPRWPMVVFGAALYLSAPAVIATLFTLGACMIWFRTYKFALPLLALFALLTWYGFGQAHAQTFIYTPGQAAPTTVMPLGGDSYSIYTPGQPPSTAMPLGNGSYSIYTPGQAAPTTIIPMDPPPLLPQPFPQQGYGR